VKGALCITGSAGATCKAFCNLDGGLPNCGGAACQAITGLTGAGACP
jgi:hypothetical protein